MLRINPQRLQNRLEQNAEIGKLANGGIQRLTLSDEDKLSREQLIGWFQEEDCEIHIDPIGNIFAVYPGKNRSLSPVLTGSHNDTQPNGGGFDGILGVLAGLEIISTLKENNVLLERDFVVAAWTNEEGCRFTPGCTGSGVWAGNFDLQKMYRLEDKDGNKMGDELERIGFKGDSNYPPTDLHAAFELHIEQGPILDSKNIPIGIPAGIVAQRWYDVDIYGESNHAGTTPMVGRKDALHTFSLIHQVIQQFALKATDLVATVGEIQLNPNSRNVIANHVHFTIDVRGWDIEQIDTVCQKIEDSIETISSDSGCTSAHQKVWNGAREEFSPKLIDLIEKNSQKLGLTSHRMYSSAGHDMVHVNQVAPGAMIFVPSINGKSHSELEKTSYADCAAGTNVLLHCVLDVANEH